MAPNAQTLYGSNKRCTIPRNTYVQVTGIEVDYGNLSKLMHHYNERDLYLMAVRNELEDRTYADWTRVKRTSYQTHDAYDTNDKDFMDVADKHEFFGVGSVLRIIPGVDITTGGGASIIPGMKVNNETIRFTVTYRPLNMFDDNIKYGLYVAFESNGIFTIVPQMCDMSLLNINNYAQLANAPNAPTYNVSRMSGRGGFLDKFTKANNFLKSTGLVSSVAGLLPGKVGKTASTALRMAGYGYDDDCGTTRMSGGQIIPPGSFYEKY